MTIRRDPEQTDPMDEVRDEINSLRDELASLAETVRVNHESSMAALQEILRELEMKSDRDD